MASAGPRWTWARSWRSFFKSLSVSAHTATMYGHTRRNLEDFFGKGRMLRAIDGGDAEKFKQYLKEQELSDSTANRRLRLARQMFSAGDEMEDDRRKPVRRHSWGVGSQQVPHVLRAACRCRQGPGQMPGGAMACPVCPEPLRGPAVPVRTRGVDLGGCRLGARPHPGAFTQDRPSPRRRVPLDSVVPGTAAAPVGSLRGGGAGHDVRHHPLPAIPSATCVRN